MKKILYISFLVFSFNLTHALVIKNQVQKPITVITNYSNEQFYRAYELKPTLLNKQPKLKINLSNLDEIQIYNKIPNSYNTGKKIDIKQIELFKDIYKNVYKKIPKNKPSELPDSLVEIDKTDLSDSEYAIMPSPQGKLTFVQIATKINK